jgi:PDZ-binding kinase
MEKTPLNLFKRKHMISQEIPASPFMKKLGFGTGIAVYLLPNKLKKNQTTSPWAVKKCLKLKHDNKMYGKRLDFEAEVLRKLTHKNIVEFKAYEMSQDGR